MKGMLFKITLLHIKPPIWRRIIVPENYSFWDFHVAIQDAFGWLDCHLHSFDIGKDFSFQIGLPDPDGYDFRETRAGYEIKIKKYIDKIGNKIRYIYDFGDDWEHEIKFEKFIAGNINEPLCIDGKRACPPEDCGGIPGYEDFCKIMAIKKGKEYKQLKEWYGEDYDPEYFDPSEVVFDDPKERFKMMQDFH